MIDKLESLALIKRRIVADCLCDIINDDGEVIQEALIKHEGEIRAWIRACDRLDAEILKELEA